MAVEFQRPSFLNKGNVPDVAVGYGVSLNMSDVAAKLIERCPGLAVDAGGRLDIWHPKISQYQSLRYWHKQICSMDRGWSPQWPTFTVEEGLERVPMDYAVAHEDFPIFDVPKEFEDGVPFETNHALIWRSQVDDVDKIGWAEVFYRLLGKRVPNISVRWLRHEFKVPMDWYAVQPGSPIGNAYAEAAEKGMVFK